MIARKIFSLSVVVLSMLVLVSCSQNNNGKNTNKLVERKYSNIEEKIDDLLEKSTARRDKNVTRMRLIESEMAVRELAKIEKNILIPYLLKLIPQEKNVDKQISMIGSLVGSGSEDYKRDIFSVVKPIYDKSDLLPVKSAVLMLMGDLNIQESFDLLVDTIKENETIYYAYIAIISIGDHGNVKAIPVLELRANSANPNIREAAEYSLEKITNPNFIPEEVVAPKTLLDKKKNLDRNQLLLKKIDSKIKDVS